MFISPFDVVLSRNNVLQPDLLFVSREQQSIITDANIQGAPALVVEVISPSTASKDRELKRRIIRRAWRWRVLARGPRCPHHIRDVITG